MRQRWTLVIACLNLLAGMMWLYVALRRFDRLSLLDGYRFPEYRGLQPHHSGDVLIPGVAGLLFLIAAALGFLRARNNPQGKTEPAVTTLFGSN